MLFNSFHYLAFLPLVVLLNYSLPHKARWAFLLAASYYFYMCWKPEYVILILISTLIDYYAAIKIHKSKTRKIKKRFLGLSLIGNLGLLLAFKYANFMGESVSSVFEMFNIFTGFEPFQLLLPVGISFYTFQSLSYTIDVYRGDREPERHLGFFALYVSFFPQLVAGPIERSTRLLPQFYKRCSFNPDKTTEGLRLILWGLFKKMVIADRLAVFVDIVYGDPGNFQGTTFILATVFFAFQIYCDFSGYTDIAIGSARILGIDLMKNFNYPYFAGSIVEFWKRWHISLTTWFRDYLYIPLGGNRVSSTRWIRNVAVVFVISGLWHGAAWTFIVWGLIHAVYYYCSLIKSKYIGGLSVFKKINEMKVASNLISIAVTFSLVCFAWIFFRAESIQDAFLIIQSILTGAEGIYFYGAFTRTDFVVAVGLILFLLVVEGVQFLNLHQPFKKDPYRILRWAYYYSLIFGILALGDIGVKKFIYFQF